MNIKKINLITFTLFLGLCNFAISVGVSQCTCETNTTSIKTTNTTKKDSCCSENVSVKSITESDSCCGSPTGIQKSSAAVKVNNDCGPEALSYVLSQLGITKKVDEIQKVMNFNPKNGANMQDIVRTAQQFGLDAKGYRMSYTELEKRELPIIIYLPNHFTVLVSIDKEKDILTFADSKQKTLTMTKEQFLNTWQGYMLEIRKPIDIDNAADGIQVSELK